MNIYDTMAYGMYWCRAKNKTEKLNNLNTDPRC